LKRFTRFLKVLVRNKRGLLGLTILIFFAIIAVVAPLLTPYDPLSISPMIASDFVYPSWFKYLPGNERLSENVQPINDSGFTTEKALQEWAFTTIPSGQSPSLKYISDVGNPIGNPGCIAISFKRDQTEATSEVEAFLTKEFYYPYQGPPRRFIGKVYVKATGVKNLTQWGHVEINVFIEQTEGQRYDLWSAKQGGNYTSEVWITPSITGTTRYPPLIDSNWLDPKGQIFSKQGTFFKQGNYRYGVEVVFTQDVQEATVYIDDIDLKLYGTVFGFLGTDELGRDLFTQLLYGTRISMIIGLLAAFLSVSIGLILGLFSGYLGKIVDELIMRFTDMFLVLPELPLLIVLIAVLGPTVWNQVITIGFLGWMGFARVVRSQVLSLKERPFVEAGKALGGGRLHIIGRHILPNVMNLVYVTLAMAVPYAIMSEAYVSFLGLFDPTIMTWGRMLHDALEQSSGVERWWWIVPPGLCIAAISTSFILIGYALDEILNPKIRERR